MGLRMYEIKCVFLLIRHAQWVTLVQPMCHLRLPQWLLSFLKARWETLPLLCSPSSSGGHTGGRGGDAPLPSRWSPLPHPGELCRGTAYGDNKVAPVVRGHSYRRWRGWWSRCRRSFQKMTGPHTPPDAVRTSQHSSLRLSGSKKPKLGSSGQVDSQFPRFSTAPGAGVQLPCNNPVCTEQMHPSTHTLQNITLNHTNTWVNYSGENKIAFHIRHVCSLTAPQPIQPLLVCLSRTSVCLCILYIYTARGSWYPYLFIRNRGYHTIWISEICFLFSLDVFWRPSVTGSLHSF